MEIVPTRAGGPDLEPILRDYRRRYHLSESLVLNTLLDALATRRAQALVAVEAGRPVGAVVLSQRGQEGQLRLLYALADAPAAEPALLAQAEELLGQGGARRVGGSLPLAPGDRLVAVLRQHGYQIIPRARLIRSLETPLMGSDLPPSYSRIPWSESRQDSAAALIDAAHRDSADLSLYPELVGVKGARQLLQAVEAGRYGRFDPALAFMALCGEELAGLALNVWHAAFSDQGFILDLAVEAAHRRRGVGRALVVATAQAFREAGAPFLGLAVTLENRPAVQLYEGLGFEVEQYFSVVHKELGEQ